jgi:hypothetical protein
MALLSVGPVDAGKFIRELQVAEQEHVRLGTRFMTLGDEEAGGTRRCGSTTK